MVREVGDILLEKIWGKLVDDEGRCSHYHQENDIVALKCSSCEKYFSCYECHDELENHQFVATEKKIFQYFVVIVKQS